MFCILYVEGVEQYALAALGNQLVVGLLEVLRDGFAALLAPRRQRLAALVVHEYAPVAAQRGGVAVRHPRPAAHREGQVKILVTVVELFVPAAHGLECAARYEKAETGENVNVMHFGEPTVERRVLETHHVITDRPRRLEAAVLGRRDQLREPETVNREGVVVEKENPRRRALGREPVVAARKVEVRLGTLGGDGHAGIPRPQRISPRARA